METLHKVMIKELVNRIFRKFKKVYGDSWLEKLGPSSFERKFSKKIWAIALLHIDGKKVEKAINNYNKPNPPSLVRFRTLCEKEMINE